MIYNGTKKVKAFYEDYKPVNVMRNGIKLAGWKNETKSGQSVEFSETYNDKALVDINGESFQENEPSPDNLIEIKSVGTYNPSTSKYEFDLVSSVGKENMLVNTSKFINLVHWTKATSVSSDLGMVIFNDSQYGNVVKMSVIGTTYAWGYFAHSIDASQIARFQVGKKYVISFDARADADSTISVSLVDGADLNRVTNASNNTITTSWARYSNVQTAIGKGVNTVVYFYLPKVAGTNVYITNLKLEESDEPTAYTPSPKEIPYNTSQDGINKIAISLDEPLGGLTEKDRVFRDIDGQWKVERKCGSHIDNGVDGYWGTQGTNAYGIISFSKIISEEKAATSSINSMCTHFTLDAVSLSLAQKEGYFVQRSASGTTLYIRALLSRFADPNVFKVWLQANPVTVQYKLETPTIEVLPDEMQISLNNLVTFYPKTYVYTINTEIKPMLTATVKIMEVI